MGIVHFLNVNEGDCIWIEHLSEHNTIIDISNGQEVTNIFESASSSGCLLYTSDAADELTLV